MVQAGSEEQRSLYQKHIPIIPRSVKGKFRSFKWGVLAFAYAIYFGLPWLPWARHDGPSQAVLFDMVGRRFFLFDLVVYPQDVFWLALLLFLAAVLLFFVTGLVGRAFCGYFCFQTLWTEAFILVERLVQGERPARIRLYKQPWNAEKVGKFALTHSVWLLLSFWTALTFILYYGYAPALTVDFFTGNAAQVAYFTVMILTATTYVAAGLAREQVCMYMCPYARFQSVMYDPETLAVAYDKKRGEGTLGRIIARSSMKSREDRLAKGYGDCIDCGLCVQVCPVGIDIREGMQFPCISCGLCIDACNGIMDSMGYPRGLIRYDSEANMESPAPVKPKLHWKRLKIIGNGAAVLLMATYLLYSIGHRTNYEETVQQIRQPLFVVLSDGQIRNRYQIRVTNKSSTDEIYHIGVSGIPETALDLGEIGELNVHAGKSLMVQASVKLEPAMANKVQHFAFIITPKSKPETATKRMTQFYSKHTEQ
nr:cytochrome c oxidase accessory protein CcoG [Sulfurirhabdus autotrophica]